jgi:hypothetical protein
LVVDDVDARVGVDAWVAAGVTTGVAGAVYVCCWLTAELAGVLCLRSGVLVL